ncbi:uncharacterized protein LOC111386176 isoform X1 [Olea europaea var. sylvestris]|uniref:uncharacterized protein LOC111386176 isoform X1 n=2 Tax=Olea europaea var. sylvestris TaxID=158386 RepID=UPI000C1D08EE|nr:uncharacterized protein LOC111386176 isoform X1 [Olea europaea var. sylvestris]
MEDVERLTALKMAYADIMLNTTKEAAARIMSSETKVARYQHELKVAKEEGLRMLLRLKQMMDSEIREAEATSSNQQKKIEEVEAQLQEAEDIVKDLREELREVQAELERVKNKNMLLVDEPDYACPREIPDRIYSAQSVTFVEPNLQNESSGTSDVRILHPYQTHKVQKCYNKTLSMNNSCIGSPDLPSIILRKKESGLYRKGCTYRIRACERNLLDGESYCSGKHDKVMDTSVRGLEEGKDTFIEPAHGTKILSDRETNLLAGVKLTRTESFVWKRKRAIRRRKYLTSPHGDQSDVQLKPIQVIDANSGENLSKMAPRWFLHKPQPGIQTRCAESSEKEAVIVECCDAEERMCQDEALIENLLLLRQETEPAESSRTPCDKLDAENLLANDLVSNSSDITSGYPDQARRERVIKYTFQRKRKRQNSSGADVNLSLETDNLERQSGNNQNGNQDLDLQKPSLETESFEDDLPLALVARQLLSLSKKW